MTDRGEPQKLNDLSLADLQKIGEGLADATQAKRLALLGIEFGKEQGDKNRFLEEIAANENALKNIVLLMQGIYVEQHKAKVVYVSEEMPKHAEIMQSSADTTVRAFGEVLGLVLENQAFRKHLPEILEPNLDSYFLGDSSKRITFQTEQHRLSLVLREDGTYGVTSFSPKV